MFMPQRGQREPLVTSVLFSNLRDTRADSLVTGTKKWEQEGSGKTQGPNLHWPAQCPVGQAAVHSHLKRSGLHWALQTPENQLDPFLTLYWTSGALWLCSLPQGFRTGTSYFRETGCCWSRLSACCPLQIFPQDAVSIPLRLCSPGLI